jgi:uncharacterized membrane protein (DUF373 family)
MLTGGRAEQRMSSMAGGTDHDMGKTAAVRAVSERVVIASEVAVVTAAELLVVVSILVAAVILYGLFFGRLAEALHAIGTMDALQAAVEKVFAGVLLLMLGLELLKSLMNFFTGFQIQVEIILVVAMIAVARHIMLIDPEHTDWTTLVGSAALVLALAVSYALVRACRSSREDVHPDEG